MVARFLIGIAGLTLGACVPSVQTVYHTPVVTGQVIDLVTLEPVVGAVVEHDRLDGEKGLPVLDGPVYNPKKNQVLSNKTGEFSLPSDSSIEPTMLMAGHALKDYPIMASAYFGNFSIGFAQASMKMFTEEKVAISPIIMDPDPYPRTQAATPSDSYIDFKKLHETVYQFSNSRLSCDGGYGYAAETSLNRARKIYWLQKGNPDRTPDLRAVAYDTARRTWNYFLSTCDFSKIKGAERSRTLRAVKEITDGIDLEVNSLGGRS